MFFKNWTKQQRIEVARAKMTRVIDHLLYLIEIHANNSIIVYSNILTKQITRSFAAHAFNNLQSSMHQFEIVRLCAIWDGIDPQKENIPTVVALVDDDEIVEILADEMGSHWDNGDRRLLNPSTDPEVAEIQWQTVLEADKLFGLKQAQRVRVDLRHAIAEAAAIQKLPPLDALMNARHKHLAHNLTSTFREKHGPVDPIKYGDETWLLELSIPVVETLYRCVNGTSFAIDTSKEFHEQNAKALWANCQFNVVD